MRLEHEFINMKQIPQILSTILFSGKLIYELMKSNCKIVAIQLDELSIMNSKTVTNRQICYKKMCGQNITQSTRTFKGLITV